MSERDRLEKEVVDAALELGSSVLRVTSRLLDSFGALKHSRPLVERLAFKVGELEREVERSRIADSNVAGEDAASEQ